MRSTTSAPWWLICALGVSCAGSAPPAPTPPPDAQATPETAQATPQATPAPQQPDAAPAPAGKEAVAATILPPDRLQGYTVRLAYDLGSVKLAVLDRPKDPQSLSVVRAQPPAAAPRADFEAAFSGASFEGQSHPLELLGYDLVQVSASGLVEGSAIPEVLFGWMRQDEDGTLERGSGSALWLRCAGESSILLVSGDGPSGEYRPESARAFAVAAHDCGS